MSVDKRRNLTKQNSLTLLIRIRYQECDPQGIVFNSRYGDFADIADTEFFRALIGDYKNFIHMGYDKRVVNYQISWKTSASFDDILHLKCHISNVGTTSYRLNIGCFKENPQESNLLEVAQIELVYVIVNTKNFSKTAIPEFLLKAFRKPFTKVVDQTGR